MSGTNPGNPAISGAAWVQPQPQAVLGLNSSMVYGSAFAGSVPLSFQLAGGGLLKLIADPVGFAEAFRDSPCPTWANAIFGSGAYGNAQVTLGTSANLVMGQVYDINIGPPKITIDYSDNGMQVVARVLGSIMLALAVLFTLGYGLWNGDDERAALVMSLQGIVQLMLGTIMIFENDIDLENRAGRKVVHAAFAANSLLEYRSLASMVCPVIGPTEVVLAAAVPPVLDSIREVKLKELIGGDSGAYSHPS